MSRTLQATQDIHLLRDRPRGLKNGLDAGGSRYAMCYLLGQDAEPIPRVMPQLVEAHLVVLGEGQLFEDELRGRL